MKPKEEPVNLYCHHCGENKAVTLDYWDSEPSDYGGKPLSSWPIFTVEPPCPGVATDWPDDTAIYPSACPFHEEFGDMCQAQETVLAVIRDRKARTP